MLGSKSAEHLILCFALHIKAENKTRLNGFKALCGRVDGKPKALDKIGELRILYFDIGIHC